MSMSKRHYEMVARVIRTNRTFHRADPHSESIIDNIVGDLAVAFASDNERFDESRFVAACELPE